MANWLENIFNKFRFQPSNAVSPAGTFENLLEAIQKSRRSAYGISISESDAMRIAAVHACIEKVAGTVSQLPVDLFKRSADGDDLLPRNDLWWLLNESIEDGWTAAAWKEWCCRCIALRGDAITLIERDRRTLSGGAVTGLRPLHPDRVRPYRRETDNQLLYEYWDVKTNKTVVAWPADIIHFTGAQFNGTRSQSVVFNAAYNAISAALASQAYLGSLHRSGALPRIVLKYPKTLQKDQLEEIRKSFVATYGANDSGIQYPLVLPEGADARELSLKPTDVQLIETLRLSTEEICVAFGVPPVLIGVNEKATSWGTGIEQIMLGFIKLKIKPLLRGFEEELNRKLYLRAPNFLRFNLDELTRGDSKAQAEFYKAALGGPGSQGWLSVNEVRAMQNRKPMDGFNEVVRSGAAATGATTGANDETNTSTSATQ
jgi:HK97 family phage portal protein